MNIVYIYYTEEKSAVRCNYISGAYLNVYMHVCSDLSMLVDTVCGSGIIWYQVAAMVCNTVCRDQLMLYILASYLHGVILSVGINN